MATKQAAQASAQTQVIDADSFSSLLDREFKPKGDQQREAVETAVRTLAEQALSNTATISEDAYSSIEAIIAEIDHKLSEQINLILHHRDFQKVESAWRGLNHLVYNTETDEKLKIRFMDITKDEVRRTVRRYKGVAWDQSPLFKKLYEEEYGQLGGEPYGALVADYYFDHTPPDVELLNAMAKIAAAAHAPFIAGASPSVLQMESWQELANPRDLTKITSNLDHAAWNSLRTTEDSRYVGLAMPRFLARLPYGAKTNPVDEFDFEEQTDGADHKKYVWNNLFKYCVTGKHIPEAKLTVRKAGGNPLEYMKITMTDVIVTMVRPTGSSTDEVKVRERVGLSFSKVKTEYTVQNQQGGSGGAVTAGYDVQANKEM